MRARAGARAPGARAGSRGGRRRAQGGAKAQTHPPPLGVVLGVPDQIFATVTQYAFLAAIAAVSMTATVSAVILQRQRP